MGKKLIMITEGIIIVALVVGVVMIQGCSQSKVKSLEKELAEVTSNHYRHDLLPANYVLSQGINTDQITQMTARATMPIFYSVGESEVRQGRVVILGKDTLADSKEYYVGFTTSCAVTLNHPWPEQLDPDKIYNEIIMINPCDPVITEDYYLKAGTKVNTNKGVALNELLSTESAQELKTQVDALPPDGNEMAGFINIPEGSYVKIIAEGQWSIRNSGIKCGPEGEEKEDNSWTIEKDYHPGCLLIYGQDEEEKEPSFITGYKKGGVSFFAHKSKILMRINDTDVSNNNGHINVTLQYGPNLNLNKIKQSQNEIKIKDFGGNDICLIYFPINPSNYFGLKKAEEIPSLGLSDPTETVDKIVRNSTNVLGQEFCLYCKECSNRIEHIQDDIEKMKAEMTEIAFEAYKLALEDKKGENNKIKRKEGIRLTLSSLPVPYAALITNLVFSMLPENPPADIRERVNSLMTKTLDETWGKYISPGFAHRNPELKPYFTRLTDVVPHDIDLRQIQQVNQQEVLLKDGSIFKMAGISINKGQEVKFTELLKGFINNASKLMVVPYKKEGNKILVHLLADDNYLNQLMVMEGVAEPDKKDKDFPFKDEFIKPENGSK
jgi:hypothetical protein